MSLVEIYTGIHTGGKTTKIRSRLDENDGWESIPESKWLMKFATVNEKYNKTNGANIEDLKSIKNEIQNRFLVLDENSVYKPLRKVLSKRKIDGVLWKTSNLQCVMIYFYVELIENINRNKNSKNSKLLMDRCIIDALYYNDFIDGEELDDIATEIVFDYFKRLIINFRLKEITIYKYSSLTYDQHVKRLNIRNRIVGDIKADKDFYNNIIGRIDGLYDKYIVKIMKTMGVKINLIDVKHKLDENGILTNVY